MNPSSRLTVRRRLPGRGLLSRLWTDGGQELVELTLTIPILLVVVFGILELGRAYDVDQAMAGLSREAANIAARGTALDTVIAVTMTNGSSINLTSRGGAIATEITIIGGVPTVTDQRSTGGLSAYTRIGAPGATAAGLSGLGLAEGRTYYAVELFYDYQGYTPLANLVSSVVPDTMYDRSIF